MSTFDAARAAAIEVIRSTTHPDHEAGCGPCDYEARLILAALLAARSSTTCEDCAGSGEEIREGTPWPIMRGLGLTEPDHDIVPCPSCFGSGTVPGGPLLEALIQKPA